MHAIDAPTDPLWEIDLGAGRQLTVLQAAGAQQCALALSLCSGSHDEPSAYLGMAHFLEHLVFRGSQNYAIDDGLMAFVQRNGGQVNAQTQALHTLFHFQVEAPLFVGALERLVDMLVSPRLEQAMLESEREVLHEEFHLYCQAPQMLMDAALALGLSAAHPLQRFYAGHRDSLAIEDAGFNQVLSAFHQSAYLSSQLNIVVVVPDVWPLWQDDVLNALRPLTDVLRDKPRGALAPINVQPSAALKLCLPLPEHYCVVHVPINQQAEGLAQLAEKLQHALVVGASQSFLAYAKQQYGCSSIKVRAPYAGSEQGVLTVEFKCLHNDCAALFAALFAWLRQWQQQLHSAEQQAYEAHAQANRWLVAQPLAKAQQILRDGWPLQGVSVACLAALEQVMQQITEQAFVQVLAGPEPVEGFYQQGLPLQVERLPARQIAVVDTAAYRFCNPLFARLEHVPCAQRLACYALAQHQPEALAQGLAVCYWGWQVAQPHAHAQRLQGHIATVQALLSYNAVQVQVECMRGYVFVRLTGPAAFLPLALPQVLAAVDVPLLDLPVAENGHFALRRLLQRLPAALVGAEQVSGTGQMAWAGQVQSALWLGQSLPEDALPEHYVQRLQRLPSNQAEQRCLLGWQCVVDDATADAVLIVHIPLPAINSADKDRMRAVNRVLSRHVQSALQRSLRDERGLCYAVLVMPSAQVEHEGLVCAVQSSKVSAARILTEIQHCLADFQTTLPARLLVLLTEILAQAEQLKHGRLSAEHLSQMLFRHWFEQRLATGLAEEARAVRSLSTADIEQYCQTIQDHQRWFILSNQADAE